MVIHSPLLLGLGIGSFVLGILLWRWAARHSINLSGAALSTAFSAAKSGRMPSVPDDLKAHYSKMAAEGTNVGRAKAVGGSVARHFLAKVVRMAALAGLLAGVVMIALALMWK